MEEEAMEMLDWDSALRLAAAELRVPSYMLRDVGQRERVRAKRGKRARRHARIREMLSAVLKAFRQEG